MRKLKLRGFLGLLLEKVRLKTMYFVSNPQSWEPNLGLSDAIAGVLKCDTKVGKGTLGDSFAFWEFWTELELLRV